MPPYTETLFIRKRDSAVNPVGITLGVEQAL
jgi:hypothetical protein